MCSIEPDSPRHNSNDELQRRIDAVIKEGDQASAEAGLPSPLSKQDAEDFMWSFLYLMVFKQRMLEGNIESANELLPLLPLPHQSRLGPFLDDWLLRHQTSRANCDSRIEDLGQ